MKEIKVPLSVNNLKELTKKFKTFQKDIKKAEKNIVDELATVAKDEIKQRYSSSPYESIVNDEKIDIAQSSNRKNTKKAFVRGTSVLYREFGTGTEGAKNAHPWKNSVNIHLNPYNSGETIRVAKDNINPESGIEPGQLYWTFKRDGKKYYTTGIPSGKEVYYASRKTRLSIKKIVKERIGGAISKL